MTNLIRTAGILPIILSMITLAVSAEPTLTQEVHELRRDIQIQTAKITSLTEQISALTHALQEKASPEQTSHPAANTSPTLAAGSIPVVTIPTQQKSSPEANGSEVAIPRAEAVSPLGQHLVEKGDTLTSIAKHYNIPSTTYKFLTKASMIGNFKSDKFSKFPRSSPPTPQQLNPKTKLWSNQTTGF